MKFFVFSLWAVVWLSTQNICAQTTDSIPEADSLYLDSFLIEADTIELMPGNIDSLPMDYANPKKYVIGGIEVDGVQYLDRKLLILLGGIYEGQTISIPGEELSRVIENLWKQNFFSSVKIYLTKIQGNKVWLLYQLEEKPRLARFSITGLSKGKSKKLREELSIQANQILTDNLIQKTRTQIEKYYVEKGYINTSSEFESKDLPDKPNFVELRIKVDPGVKVKVDPIIINGNNAFDDKKIQGLMRNTKRKVAMRLWKRSKFKQEEFQEDLERIVTHYNSNGYRDMVILGDSSYQSGPSTVGIVINIDEGPKYYFRNISWVGNSKFTSEQLSKVLKIERGQIYNYSLLEKNLRGNPQGMDVSALYMDDGYLFFQVDPVEVAVEHDSIDLEIRIMEGPQATINKVTVSGNTKTSDYVVLRELRTRPGMKFSRSDIQRSVRDLAQLGYFDPEKLDVQPVPNPANGTVDIEYKVEERSNDQIELSGGFGQGFLVGTLGLSLNNFSTRRFFDKNAWTPIPSGDGQRLTLRLQSSGFNFRSYNFSFTEPWFGGKKPNAFSISFFHSVQQLINPRNVTPEFPQQSLRTSGVTIGLGTRLKWPDDYFILNRSITFQRYDLNNFQRGFQFNSGQSNTINLKIVLSRNSTDVPLFLFPTSGSSLTLSLAATPPFSRISGRDYSEITDPAERFKWVEYYKGKAEFLWFTKLVGKFVVSTQVRFGYMGFYNRDIGVSPYERFFLGGAGLMGFALDGRELIAMRGYRDNSITPRNQFNEMVGGNIYNKYTIELRYPITSNPQASIYMLTFTEAGNNWLGGKQYNPFKVLRSAGVGIRVFLPMFGLLGVDWANGFDPNPITPGSGGSQFHFFIGQQF